MNAHKRAMRVRRDDERELLEMVFLAVAHHCGELEPMIGFEQDLLRLIAGRQPDQQHADAEAARVRGLVNQAWRRLVHFRLRQRARLHHAVFDKECALGHGEAALPGAGPSIS